MSPGFSGNLIFAIIARMLCGNHLKSFVRHICITHAHDPNKTRIFPAGFLFRRAFSPGDGFGGLTKDTQGWGAV